MRLDSLYPENERNTSEYIEAWNGTGLPVGIRRRAARQTIALRTARVVDRLITRVQEWLEGPDTVRVKGSAYLLIWCSC
jgi:hypothetical protein